MAAWREVEAAAPALAAEVRRLMEAHRHKTIATIRRDGSPRISGIEAEFRDGELWIGCMPGSAKVGDLRRDPRFALHSGSDDPPAWRGDAKIGGRMVEGAGPDRERAANGSGADQAPAFRAEITEVSAVRLNAAGDGLEIDSWREGGEVIRRLR